MMAYTQAVKDKSGQPTGRVKAYFRLDGKPKYVGMYDSEAQAMAAGLRAELPTREDDWAPTAAKRILRSKSGTLGQVAVEWLARQHAQASATRDMYRTNITGATGLVTMPIAAMALDEIRKSDVDTMLAAAKTQGMGASSRKNRLKVLGMILRDAKRNGLVDTVVTEEVRSERVIRRIGVYLTEEQEEAILEACGDDAQIRLAVLLGMDAGLRWEEYSALQIDLATPELLKIRRAQERSRVIVDRTKSWHDRDVPVLTDRLAMALSEAIAQARRDGSMFLLHDAAGQPLRYELCRDRFVRIMARAGVDARGHDLRHTFASKLSDGMVPPDRIRVLLGHADLATTQKYIHHRVDASSLARERAALSPRGRHLS